MTTAPSRVIRRHPGISILYILAVVLHIVYLYILAVVLRIVLP